MCFVPSHSNGHQALLHCTVATAAQQKQEHWHLSGIRVGVSDIYPLFTLFVKWRLIIIWEGRLVKGICGFWNNQQIPTQNMLDWGLLKLMPYTNTKIISDLQSFKKKSLF